VKKLATRSHSSQTYSAADQVAVAGDGLGLGEPGVVAGFFFEMQRI
jgi:hypothetical protein